MTSGSKTRRTECATGGVVGGGDAGGASRVERILGSDVHVWWYGPTVSSRTPLVMLHGLRGTHHGLELIAQRFADRPVVIPDLPGFGRSGPMSDSGHDVPGYTRMVDELLRRLGAPDRPVDLLGHSFGSIVAARTAARDSGAIRALVLVNPICGVPGRGMTAALARLTSGFYALAERLPARLGATLLSDKRIVLATSAAMVRTRDPRLRRFVHDSHLRHFSSFHDPALVAETYRASLAENVGDHAGELDLPTLLIAGETDEIAPLTRQRALASRLRGSRLSVIGKVGHLVHYETPGAAANEIRCFLDRL